MKKKAKKIANLLRNETEDVLSAMQEAESMGIRYDVYADGSNNNGVSGCGWVVLHKGNITKSGSLSYKSEDSVGAEILAILFGVKTCPKDSRVDVYTDCQPAILKLLSNNMDDYLRNIYRKVAKGKDVHYHYIRGHSMAKYNDMADSLAFNASTCDEKSSE